MAALLDAQALLCAIWSNCGGTQQLDPTRQQSQPRVEDYKELSGILKLVLTSSPEPEFGCAAISVAGVPSSPENYNCNILAQFCLFWWNEAKSKLNSGQICFSYPHFFYS